MDRYGYPASWKRQAACLSDPGAHWDGDLLPSMWDLCSGCPVIRECLAEGMTHDYRDDVGVWGGTTVEQRNRMRRKRLTPERAWEENANLQEALR
jgi:hypothetical protein